MNKWCMCLWRRSSASGGASAAAAGHVPAELAAAHVRGVVAEYGLGRRERHALALALHLPRDPHDQEHLAIHRRAIQGAAHNTQLQLLAPLLVKYY